MSVSASAISRVTGVTVTPKNFNTGNAAMLPQRLVVIGQGNDDVTYSTSKYECEGTASEIGEKYGYGSPLHLAARQLFPQSGSQATFPVTFIGVEKPTSGVAASGTVVVSGTATEAGSGTVSIGGLDVEVAISKGDTGATVMANIVTAVNAELNRCVTAVATETNDVVTAATFTARWSGALGNRISLSWDGDIDGLTVTVTAMSGGTLVPSIEDALTEIGTTVWETFVLNTFDYKDSSGDALSLLDDYQTWGEGRWDTLTKMPALVAHGCVDSYSVRTAISDARKTDYINFFITSVGSEELPFVIAAKALLGMLTVADSNPPQNYKNTLTGLKRGSDSVQETYTVRNQSVLKGASTNIVNGSVAELNDIVTFYHPDADGKYPSRRYVVDAVKLMNIVYNLRLITEADDVKGAPLVPDSQVTSNATALQPKTFKTWFRNLATSLGLNALISDVDFTQENITVEIDSENSKRVNYVFPVKVSGNVEVVSGDVYFGQYVG